MKLFTHLMPVWVVLLGILGYVYPPALSWFKPYIAWMFFGTILGMGCAMELASFRPLLRNPLLVRLGVFAQFLIMPLCGFLIGKALHFPPGMLIGMVLVGAVPGAMASNVMACLARTDVADSIALTSTASLLVQFWSKRPVTSV